MENEKNKKITVIDGNCFSDLKGFYEEVSQLFMKDEDWKLDELIDGNGKTLFEILIEIIKSHKNITLILD